MRSLSHLLAVLTAAGAVSAMNIGYPLAQRTSPSVPLEDTQGTSPAPTKRPILRFRNAHVARQQKDETCGWISNQQLVDDWEPIVCEGSCKTENRYIGCGGRPATACYPGSASSICGPGGSAGSRDLCCTRTTSGFQARCVTLTMMSGNSVRFMFDCARSLYSSFNTLSLYMYEETTTSTTSTTTPSTTSTTLSTTLWGPSMSLSPSPSPLPPSEAPNNVSTASPTPFESGPTPASTPVGAIVGGVVGGIAVIALAACIIAWLLIRRRKGARAAGGGAHPPPNGPEPILPYVPGPGDSPTSNVQPLPSKGGGSPGIYEVPRHTPTLQANSPPPAMAMYAASAVVEPVGTQNQLNGGASYGSSPPIYEAPTIHVTGSRDNPAQMG